VPLRAGGFFQASCDNGISPDGAPECNDRLGKPRLTRNRQCIQRQGISPYENLFLREKAVLYR
jgi:hypothetical protein